jgi:hypothetical protein
MDVEQYDIGRSLPDHLNGSLDLGGLADQVDGFVQLAPDSDPEQVMVIDHEDSHQVRHSAAPI